MNLSFKFSGFSDEIDKDIIIQFTALNKMGIRYFEPRGINGTNIADLSDEEVENLITVMNLYGIKASSIGSPIGKIFINEDFAPHFEKYKRTVWIAKKLGAKYIRMFSFFIPQGENPADHRDEVFDRLRQLIDYAKQEDIILLHENEKDIYGDTIARCEDLFENLYCDNFKGVFDAANFVQCGENTVEAFDRLRKYEAYFHVKDSKEDGTIVPPGQGLGNYPYIMKKLIDEKYDGFVSMEPHLGSFEGLADLELDDKMLKLEKGGEETFALAFNSLCEIIERVQK